MKRFLWLFVIVFLFLICTGCGDTFRPVIIPNPPKFPDPRAAHTVVTISDNGDLPGSAMVVDVTGDSDVSEADCQEGSPCIGIAPVHAVQQTATQVLVVNQSVSGALGDSLSKVNFSGTTISGVTTISLPPDSAPNFVAVAPLDTTAYVTLPNFVPDPINSPNVVVPSVGLVSTTTNALVNTIPVQDDPVAIAVTPDKNKLYVANQGSSSVSCFNTVDRSPRNAPITLSSPPIWLAARSDNQRVFVLESNGTLAVLDTTSTAGPDTVTETAISVPGALSMLYDGHLNRLYIPGGNQLAVVDALLNQGEAAIAEAKRAVEMLSISKDAVEGPRIAMSLAVVYAWSNEPDLAFETIGPLTKTPNGIYYGELKRDPYWDPLRKDPRFEKLLAELAPKD